MVHHIIVQTSLFLVTGLIERRGGTSNVDRLGSLARLSPVLAVLFFIPAMNLAGIPPFSGFLGKLGLIQGGVELGTPLGWVLVGGSVATSLLTLLAVARVWNRAFWRKAEDAENPDPLLLVTAADGSRDHHLPLRAPTPAAASAAAATPPCCPAAWSGPPPAWCPGRRPDGVRRPAVPAQRQAARQMLDTRPLHRGRLRRRGDLRSPGA